MATEVPFRALVKYTIGGGWGEENPQPNTIATRVIRGTDFSSIISGSFEAVPTRFEECEKVRRRLLQPGDIVLEISGGSRVSNQSTGRSLLITQEILDRLGGTVIPASFCRLIRLQAEIVDPLYVYYSLQEMYKSGRAELYEHHSTGISNFQFEYFLDHELIRLPPLPEQRAIAHILGTLDNKIELNRRMSQTLEAMARALFKAWFVDFEPVRAKMEGRWRRGESLPGMPAELYDLFPDRLVPSELGEIPEGWAVGRLEDLAAVKSGKRPSTPVSSTSTDGADISLWGGNGPMGYVCDPLFSDPIILTGRVGTLGSVFRITDPCWPSDNTLVVLPNDESVFEYVYFCMKGIDYEALNRGSTQPLLAQTDLMNQTILIPSRAVVVEFHRHQAAYWSRIDKMNSESRTLAALRDALLPKLIRGEIRVKDVERFLKEAERC